MIDFHIHFLLNNPLFNKAKIFVILSIIYKYQYNIY